MGLASGRRARGAALVGACSALPFSGTQHEGVGEKGFRSRSERVSRGADAGRGIRAGVRRRGGSDPPRDAPVNGCRSGQCAGTSMNALLRGRGGAPSPKRTNGAGRPAQGKRILEFPARFTRGRSGISTGQAPRLKTIMRRTMAHERATGRAACWRVDRNKRCVSGQGGRLGRIRLARRQQRSPRRSRRTSPRAR